MYTRGLAEAAIQHLRERGWQCEPVSVSETPLPEVLEPAPGELITWVVFLIPRRLTRRSGFWPETTTGQKPTIPLLTPSSG